MAVEVLGIDHVYFSVLSLAASERFYDAALSKSLGFRKHTFDLHGDPHIQYYNRQFGVVIRPSRSKATEPAPAVHVRGAPGLHHLCLRVDTEADVDRVARSLGEHGITATAPRYFPEYAPDYYATFFSDPDGTELEMTNFRAERRARVANWDDGPAAGD